MPRVGQNIYKRKDGRWEGRYIKEKVNGKSRYGSVYASTYRDVKQKLDTAKLETERMRHFNEPVRSMKVKELSDDWLEEASIDLKESSVVKYEDLLRCHILPVFGDKEISAITNEDFTAFINFLRVNGGKEHRGLAISTISEIITTMNALKTYALKKNYNVFFSTKCIMLKHEKSSIRVFTTAEEKCLMHYLTEHMDTTALGICLCLYTGIRVGELCALKWDAINFSEKTMLIGRTMQRLRVHNNPVRKTEVKILEPKSASSERVIPIPESLLPLLSKFYVADAYILTGDSRRFAEPRLIQKKFKRILKNCGIADANFHATRHTFATRCIESGFDVKSLSEILGHANVNITLNRYVHPSMELKQKNMNRLSEYLNQ